MVLFLVGCSSCAYRGSMAVARPEMINTHPKGPNAVEDGDRIGFVVGEDDRSAGGGRKPTSRCGRTIKPFSALSSQTEP
jgi:hypothetical protein